MRFQLRERNIELNTVLRAQVENRLSLALGRYGIRIEKVIVRLSTDGRLDGEGKQCKIEVGLRPRTVIAEDSDADLLTAVDRAVNRVSRSVGRALEDEGDRNGSWPKR
jgi:ribosome hibernation promoting factor